MCRSQRALRRTGQLEISACPTPLTADDVHLLRRAMTADNDPGLVSRAAERAAQSGDSPFTPAVDPTASPPPAAPGAPTPDIKRTADAVGSARTRSVEATVLT